MSVRHIKEVLEDNPDVLKMLKEADKYVYEALSMCHTREEKEAVCEWVYITHHDIGVTDLGRQ